MATVSKPATVSVSSGIDAERIMKALGSLKLTVALFALSLLLVLVGTLAQDELNMQDVKSRYFLSWIAMLRFDDFFPQAFYAHDQPIPGVLPIPGGALVGVLLMVNLLAAKITRFKMHARGGRLAVGLGFLAAGVAIAGLIVASGHSSDGLQGAPPITYPQLWGCLMGGLTMATLAILWAAVRSSSWTVRIWLGLFGLGLVAFLIFASLTGYRIGDPGLRIVWQLLKGVGAGAVLLVGCQLLFDKQGGNVLLHLGVGLLMVGQFAFGDRQLEQRLSLVEEEMTNTFVNLDQIELTFLTESEDLQDFVAVPAEKLIAALRSEETIQDAELPVDIRVVKYIENAKISLIDPSKAQPDNPATVGAGKEVIAVELPKSGGTDNRMNLPAAYVELLDKESGESMGTHLVAQQISDRKFLEPGEGLTDLYDDVEVDGKTYKMGLRLHREVKPYWVKLEDVRRVNYSGTSTPRDYSSFIRIVDNETGDDRRERVWMNNPLRYRGETFFQSKYSPVKGGREWTEIQVVRNSGWLIPYVACSIIALGMAAHFWGTLTRFVGRRRREQNKTLNASGATEDTDATVSLGTDDLVKPKRKLAWVPNAALAATVLFVIACLVPRTLIMGVVKPAETGKEMNQYTLGMIPTQFGGRVMPLDAYARQTLKAMSNKESLPLDGVPSEIAKKASGRRLSALEWLMEVAVDNPKIYFTPMFRIDADEVLAELGGLERREHKLYSYDEIDRNRTAIRKQLEVAFEKQEENPLELTFKEKKLIELELRKRRFLTTAVAMRLPVPRTIPEDRLPEGITADMAQQFAFSELQNQMQAIAGMNAPRIIPPAEKEVAASVDQPEWTSFAPGFFNDAKSKAGVAPAVSDVGIKSFGEMLKTYGQQDYLAFNEAIDDHLAAVTAYEVPGYVSSKVSVERWMNATHPNTVAIAIYILGLILCLAHFAFGSDSVRRLAWSTVLVSFIVHTLVLAARVYVTGRAPVINLYSTAVFIGWGAVFFGLLVERIYRYGTGTFMASIAGALTLQVAYGLTLNVGQGDTMPVLQAVLDTQFWLSTHVISVSLGYVATMVAGLLGIAYLVAGWIGKGDRPLRELYSSVYGATCLGILFSTIGTILGGLWADDSWGRFWGWDPKENGALLIVIWNALMLHARWDKMVGGRGFSILAIGGNIITAWSWFGTNELGIGLHSYGFTEGTKFWLLTFFVTQAAFIVAGLVVWNRKDAEAA